MAYILNFIIIFGDDKKYNFQNKDKKSALYLPCWLISDVFTKISEAGLPKADKVIVIKSKRIMLLLSDGEILRTYRVALGKNPEGRKIMAGDKKTPEGRYTLSKNSNSRFHLSLRISYPNEADIERASRLGVLPGGDIMIHGLPEGLAEFGKFHRYYDWTDGCIAVTNSEIEEIYQMVDDGTPIEIMP